jgi:hypothetical protein
LQLVYPINEWRYTWPADKSWFYLNEHVNMMHNSWYWCLENPGVLHEAPLHDPKVGVWCGISARRIIGLIFFMDTLNSERYINLILNRIFPELTEKKRLHSYFQQDSRAHSW